MQIFTDSPLSPAVPALLSNGFGYLTTVEETIVIAELFISDFLIRRLSLHLFRYGSIKHSGKLLCRRNLPQTQHTVPHIAAQTGVGQSGVYEVTTLHARSTHTCYPKPRLNIYIRVTINDSAEWIETVKAFSACRKAAVTDSRPLPRDPSKRLKT